MHISQRQSFNSTESIIGKENIWINSHNISWPNFPSVALSYNKLLRTDLIKQSNKIKAPAINTHICFYVYCSGCIQIHVRKAVGKFAENSPSNGRKTCAELRINLWISYNQNYAYWIRIALITIRSNGESSGPKQHKINTHAKNPPSPRYWYV